MVEKKKVEVGLGDGVGFSVSKEEEGSVVARASDVEKIAEFLVEEDRLRHALVNGAERKVKDRIFLVVTAEFTVLTLIFHQWTKFYNTPAEKAFFFGALFVIAFFICVLLYFYRGVKNWSLPVGKVEREKIRHVGSYLEVLKVANDDYQRAIWRNNGVLEKNVIALNIALVAFIICDIILVVLKIFS